MTAGRLDAMKKAIVGLVMSVDEVAGSFKLNQHKSDVDHAAVAAALAQQADAAAQQACPDACGRCGRHRSCGRGRTIKTSGDAGRGRVMGVKKIGILGASGYSGADALRLLARHPDVEIVALTANTHVGKAMGEVFPHFFMLELPRPVEWESVDWTKLDAVFCGLPHGTTQEINAAVLAANPEIKILDMSADFRLRDMADYAQWYGHEHRAPELQRKPSTALPNYREKIAAHGWWPAPAVIRPARCWRLFPWRGPG